MNELLLRKTAKKVMSYGISKHVANDIAEAIVTMGVCNIDSYIEYSLALIMDYSFTQRKNIVKWLYTSAKNYDIINT